VYSRVQVNLWTLTEEHLRGQRRIIYQLGGKENGKVNTATEMARSTYPDMELSVRSLAATICILF